MKTIPGSLLLVGLISIALAGCQPAEPKWQTLFNGSNLEGWDTYLGPRHKTGGDPADSIPLGLNQDPHQVFSIVSQDGSPAIRISGENHGGISTKQEFQNYHLIWEFKWGQNKIPSFKDRKRDSGLLYHAVGPWSRLWFLDAITGVSDPGGRLRRLLGRCRRCV